MPKNTIEIGIVPKLVEESHTLATLRRMADALDAIHGTLEEWRLAGYEDRVERREASAELVPDNEKITWDEFEKKYHFRQAERCCENCAFGNPGYEGECDCEHPCLTASGANGRYCNDVCDLWEKEARHG